MHRPIGESDQQRVQLQSTFQPRRRRCAAAAAALLPLYQPQCSSMLPLQGLKGDLKVATQANYSCQAALKGECLGRATEAHGGHVHAVGRQ